MFSDPKSGSTGHKYLDDNTHTNGNSITITTATSNQYPLAKLDSAAV